MNSRYKLRDTMFIVMYIVITLVIFTAIMGSIVALLKFGVLENIKESLSFIPFLNPSPKYILDGSNTIESILIYIIALSPIFLKKDIKEQRILRRVFIIINFYVIWTWI